MWRVMAKRKHDALASKYYVYEKELIKCPVASRAHRAWLHYEHGSVYVGITKPATRACVWCASYMCVTYTWIIYIKVEIVANKVYRVALRTTPPRCICVHTQKRQMYIPDKYDPKRMLTVRDVGHCVHTFVVNRLYTAENVQDILVCVVWEKRFKIVYVSQWYRLSVRMHALKCKPIPCECALSQGLRRTMWRLEI